MIYYCQEHQIKWGWWIIVAEDICHILNIFYSFCLLLSLRQCDDFIINESNRIYGDSSDLSSNFLFAFPTENWAIPVGVSLGLAAVGAITGSVIFFWRRNRRQIKFHQNLILTAYSISSKQRPVTLNISWVCFLFHDHNISVQ